MSKAILITGASTGFGRDTAETLARAGHTVFASFRDIDGRNRVHTTALRAQNIHVVELDVTNDASVDAAVRAVLSQSKRLDVLINNAGIGAAGVSEAFTPDQVQALFNINVLGVQRTLRAALPAFRKQKDGLIINIGSILGRVTFPFLGLYGASKFALEAMTESYRYELSQSGIDVVLVQPSAYPTPFFTSYQQPADPQRASEYGAVGEIPGMMVGTFMERFKDPNAPNPHDVAEAITTLVSQPKGTRAARTVVGNGFGADVINRDNALVQAQTVAALGLAQLDLAVHKAA